MQSPKEVVRGKKNEPLAWPNARVIFSRCLLAALLPPNDDVQDREKSAGDENEISVVDDLMNRTNE